MRTQLVVGLFIGMCANCPTSHALAEDNNWPQWRGPTRNGHTTETGLPTKWSDKDIVWRTTIEGQGQSSPVIWGQKIFLTAARQDGRERVVLCFDRRDGKVIWERVAWRGDPEETHAMNFRSAATCATDGERVVAFFGRGGIHCYDLDGKPMWSRELGQFEGPWGSAASPVIVDDLIIQNCDADNKAYLLALNRNTGETVWQTPREQIRGWSTPVLIESGGRRELVLNGHSGVHSYDPKTGKELWFCQGSSGRGTPTVTPANGLLYVVNGRSGATYAVRPGGNGDVTETHQAWRINRSGRDLPSPIVVGKYVLIANLRPGVVTCYDAMTGEEYWRARVGPTSASPIAANGLIYLINEAGETHVIRPDKTEDIVATNKIGNDPSEIFRASLAPSQGQVFCRSNKVLYCIGRGRVSTGQDRQ